MAFMNYFDSNSTNMIEHFEERRFFLYALKFNLWVKFVDNMEDGMTNNVP
jgi:hypothetical protein